MLATLVPKKAQFRDPTATGIAVRSGSLAMSQDRF
jgi:hypothetical protein